MTDAELTRALERGEIDNKDFHHASHLHVAWTYLSESASVQDAGWKMREDASALRDGSRESGKVS
ncbi:MAG: hypothetical protein DME50_12260 [Verrucomicrobia bacterium]|nr:MAG: hypothetical protein DME85_00115 [Verrucomicrobiota bacterium]PYK64683.1 MAG: hypothetical protein DME50_12260 [Verrucomicrobiota bacterium]